jgi:hypothetical protein
VLYLEHIKRAVLTERGLHLTFNSGDAEESMELSAEAIDQTMHALQKGEERSRQAVDAQCFGSPSCANT